MGLLDKLKMNKKKEDLMGPLLSGTKKKEPSYAMLIPMDDKMLDNVEALVRKLVGQSFINVVSTTTLDGGWYKIALEYKGESFELFVSVDDFELPELYRIGHDFTDEEIAVMESAKRGLISHMVFGENNCASYHLQIKLLLAMIEEPAGIVDFSAERMLSGRWAKLAAQSEVPPSPDYLYVAQAVSGENGKVWVHTHGLHRCGGVELEILDSDVDNYSGQGAILTALASRIISESCFVKEFEPVYIMQLGQDVPLVATWVSWHRAVWFYDHTLLGGMEDRLEGHNENTGAIFLYLTPEDEENKKVSTVCVYNDLYDENVMQMITTEETDRMRRLARERLSYLIWIFENQQQFENCGIIVKVGLEVDDEYKDGDMKEHIWFELKSIDEDNSTFEAELTQEPFYVAALKEGDMRTCRFDEITDWAAYVDGDRITPDSVYKLTR